MADALDSKSSILTDVEVRLLSPLPETPETLVSRGFLRQLTQVNPFPGHDA